jgi:hypothetical protein
MLGFTGNLLPSNKNIFLHGAFRIKRKCDTGERLHSTTGQSVVDRNKIQYGLQGIDILVPLHALPDAPHRSCVPCSRPMSDSNIKLPFFSNEVLWKGKISRLED